MTERERLTELILNAPKIEFPFGSRAQGKTYQTASNIAEHLLANGVIVPPCKAGDMLYHPFGGKILEYKVLSWSVRMDGVVVTTHSLQTGGLLTIWGSSIGETYFFTREEAEKAPKERAGK